MAINKVVLGDTTLLDLTGDNVTPETLAEGAIAHDAAGNVIEGTMPIDNVRYGAQSLTDAQKQQARTNIGAAAESHSHDAADITGIENLLSGAAKIQVGSYTGTNTYGSKNKNTLTFGFKPKFFVVWPTQSKGGASHYISDISSLTNCIWWFEGSSGYQHSDGKNVYVTASDNGIEWYSTSVKYQCNSAELYYYMALG